MNYTAAAEVVIILNKRKKSGTNYSQKKIDLISFSISVPMTVPKHSKFFQIPAFFFLLCFLWFLYLCHFNFLTLLYCMYLLRVFFFVSGHYNAYFLSKVSKTKMIINALRVPKANLNAHILNTFFFFFFLFLLFLSVLEFSFIIQQNINLLWVKYSG